MLASLIAAFASGETVRSLRQVRRAAVAYLLAAIVALCGVGFLVGAGYIWASRRYGDLEAATGFGIGFLVLAGLVLLIHKLASRSRAKNAAKMRSSELTTIAAAATLAALPVLLRNRAGLGALLTPVAAIVAYAIYRENSRPDTSDRED